MLRVAPAYSTDSAPPVTPLHGYRGETRVTARPPRGLTVVITRQAGARGGRIAKRVGQILGWQLFDQEMLGYLVQSESAKAELLADVPPEALAWANLEYARQLDLRHLNAGDQTELLRLAFVLAAKGEVVLVGRGVGELLPEATTINARVIAPLAQRIAYFSQWLRLTPDEAEIEVASNVPPNARSTMPPVALAPVVGWEPTCGVVASALAYRDSGEFGLSVVTAVLENETDPARALPAEAPPSPPWALALSDVCLPTA